MELPLKYLLYWLGLVEVPEFDLLFDGLGELELSLFLLLLVLELFFHYIHKQREVVEIQFCSVFYFIC